MIHSYKNLPAFFNAANDEVVTVSQAQIYELQSHFPVFFSPLIANEITEMFLIAATEKGTDRNLYLDTKGWQINLKAGVVKAAVISAFLGGSFLYLGYDMIPGYLLPTVIPLLFEIEKCELSANEESIIQELYLHPQLRDKPRSVEEIYALLPVVTRRDLSMGDFRDFMESCQLAGFVNQLNPKAFTFNPKENPKFRITFK